MLKTSDREFLNELWHGIEKVAESHPRSKHPYKRSPDCATKGKILQTIAKLNHPATSREIFENTNYPKYHSFHVLLHDYVKRKYVKRTGTRRHYRYELTELGRKHALNPYESLEQKYSRLIPLFKNKILSQSILECDRTIIEPTLKSIISDMNLEKYVEPKTEYITKTKFQKVPSSTQEPNTETTFQKEPSTTQQANAQSTQNTLLKEEEKRELIREGNKIIEQAKQIISKKDKKIKIQEQKIEYLKRQIQQQNVPEQKSTKISNKNPSTRLIQRLNVVEKYYKRGYKNSKNPLPPEFFADIRWEYYPLAVSSESLTKHIKQKISNRKGGYIIAHKTDSKNLTLHGKSLKSDEIGTKFKSYIQKHKNGSYTIVYEYLEGFYYERQIVPSNIKPSNITPSKRKKPSRIQYSTIAPKPAKNQR